MLKVRSWHTWRYRKFYTNTLNPNILYIVQIRKAWNLTVNPRFPLEKSELQAQVIKIC